MTDTTPNAVQHGGTALRERGPQPCSGDPSIRVRRPAAPFGRRSDGTALPSPGPRHR